MKIRMLQSRPGSPDGVFVQWYERGLEYDFASPGETSLANVFLREGWAELVEPKAQPAAPEDKDLGMAPANKTRTGGAGRRMTA